RHWRKRSSAADLHFDRFYDRLLLPRRVLVGDRPSRRLRGPTKLALALHGIDFDHNAVDLIGQCLALRFPACDEFEDLGRGLTQAPMRIYFKAELLERGE